MIESVGRIKPELNLSALHDIRALLIAANPSVRLIVTVSPVPLSLSFSCRDVAVAGVRAKSTLRSAAPGICFSF